MDTPCAACEVGDQESCEDPEQYAGDPRGDNYEVIRCCCAPDPEPDIDDIEF